MRLKLAALLCLASTLSSVDAAFRTNAHDDVQFGHMQKRGSSPGSPPAADPCAEPKGGWDENSPPPVHCGNSVLLDWCHGTDNAGETTMAACWDKDDHYHCSLCPKVKPGHLGDLSQFARCLSDDEKQAICQACGVTCPSPGPSPPSGSPKQSPGGNPSPRTPSPAEAPAGSPSPASPSSGGKSSPSGKSSHSEKKKKKKKEKKHSPKLDCNKPPNGWNPNKEPPVECGNDVLLEWCKAEFDPAQAGGYTTISACWFVDGVPKDTTAYCGGCPANPKGGENSPPIWCMNQTQQDAICEKCPTTCPPPDNKPKPDCSKPKTGWIPHQPPDHRCGNEVLMDWCHGAFDTINPGHMTYAACYLPHRDDPDNYEGYCLGCGSTPKAGVNAPYAPCFNQTQLDLVCNDKCPGTCTKPS